MNLQTFTLIYQWTYVGYSTKKLRRMAFPLNFSARLKLRKIHIRVTQPETRLYKIFRSSSTKQKNTFFSIKLPTLISTMYLPSNVFIKVHSHEITLYLLLTAPKRKKILTILVIGLSVVFPLWYETHLLW